MTVIWPLLVGAGATFATAPVIALMVLAGAKPGDPAKFATLGGAAAAGVFGYIVADHNWYGVPLGLVGFAASGFMVMAAMVGWVNRRNPSY